jgi:DNA-binding HxlR family transcriptional regulator
MPKRYGQPCPVAESLDLVGERWTLLIVRDLIRGPARFQDLRTTLPGIPTRLLSERLKFMTAQGLVARKFYSDDPPRAHYALTDKGRDLGLVVGALAAWGARHSRRKMGAVHADCGRPIDVVLRCPHCDDRVRPGSVQIPPAATATMKRARRRR